MLKDNGHAADPIDRLFAERGVRCTRQRRAIFEALREARHHPTADELCRQVRRNQPQLSLATVYNTLDALHGAGLVKRLAGAGCGARYDAADHDHLHLRCGRTGRVDDAPEHLSRRLIAGLPGDVLEAIERETGFQVEQLHIELVGRYNGDG